MEHKVIFILLKALILNHINMHFLQYVRFIVKAIVKKKKTLLLFLK